MRSVFKRLADRKGCLSYTFALALLTGCASPVVQQVALQANYEDLYLRGTFSWWEADESFKVQKVQPKLFKVVTKLIADGEPYDFKFADAKWTPGLTCGRKAGFFTEEFLRLDKTLTADCQQGENFRFVPEESGHYAFYIDFNRQSPEVYVIREG